MVIVIAPAVWEWPLSLMYGLPVAKVAEPLFTSSVQVNIVCNAASLLNIIKEWRAAALPFPQSKAPGV